MMSRKTTLVTGGSSGIGRGIAIKFAQERWDVVVTGRNTDELENTKKLCLAHNVEALTVVADMTVEVDVQRIMDETISKFSRLDCLVNNAGMYALGGIEGSDLDQFDQVIKTNLRSVYQLTKLAVPHLINSKGTIVNISSVVSLFGASASLTYAMSKAALDEFTKCLAMELAPKQVRVNSVNPGVVPTNALQRAASLTDESVEETLKALEALTPLQRNGTVEEIANTVFFLASDASSFTTGNLISVDGGLLRTSPLSSMKPIGQ